eukprot:Plantae.Rhodophyta-Purpureofilum_apyrenoidigerum.ctg7011.p1 GENE.Plantae.Rhodophyta-Purpureofilum_apyrenoidigerum.ctg7011~~Plantae.Rhodophyta-Purpureofilum_apyrenoidigerum.ctg7011.p1  ORF type:complete len:684 (-),score=137.73 Plantae.Rhodophyta-Purpureofilum_apyrenoidigerum.ctg7011:2849-4900(-)
MIGFTGPSGFSVKTRAVPVTRDKNGRVVIRASSIRRRFDFDATSPDTNTSKTDGEQRQPINSIGAGNMPGEGIKIDVGADYLDQTDSDRDQSHVSWIAERNSKLKSLQTQRFSTNNQQRDRRNSQQEGQTAGKAPKLVSKPPATIDVYRSPFRKLSEPSDEAADVTPSDPASGKDKAKSSGEKPAKQSSDKIPDFQDDPARSAKLKSEQDTVSDSKISKAENPIVSASSSTTIKAPEKQSEVPASTEAKKESEGVNAHTEAEESSKEGVTSADSVLSSSESTTLQGSPLQGVKSAEPDDLSPNQMDVRKPEQKFEPDVSGEEKAVEPKSETRTFQEKDVTTKTNVEDQGTTGTEDNRSDKRSPPAPEQPEAATKSAPEVEESAQRERDAGSKTQSANKNTKDEAGKRAKSAEANASSDARQTRDIGEEARDIGDKAQKQAQSTVEAQIGNLGDNVRDAAETAAESAESAAKQAAEVALQAQETLASRISEQIGAIKDTVDQATDAIGDIFNGDKNYSRARTEHKTAAREAGVDTDKESEADSTAKSTEVDGEQARQQAAEKSQLSKSTESQPSKNGANRSQPAGGRSGIINSVLNTMRTSPQMADSLPSKNVEKLEKQPESARFDASKSIAGLELSKLRDQNFLKRLTVPRLKEVLSELGLKTTGKKAELISRVVKHVENGNL